MPINGAQPCQYGSRRSGLLDGNEVARTHALRFVVRDMGNRVDRIEHASLVPLEDARIEAGLHGWHPIAYPYPDRFYDAGVAACWMLDIDVSGMNKFIISAVVRVIDERTIELLSYGKEYF